ncbi:MAG: glycosyltransferase family 4 protein, partial [Deltaproteobacteria bacterium]|nr:glycosyltransferase family 4 protein [Deltaproteobacteria bacterium]
MWSIVHTEWSDGFGGQEHRILLECREMLRRGHRVRIACRPEAALFPKAREAGIPATPVAIRSSADLSSIRALFSLFRRERVQIVNTHSGKDSWVASAAAKIAGAPLLIRTRHISVPIRRHAFNLVYRWPDGYITTGEMIREHLLAEGIPADRVVSIPTGVDPERFSPAVDGTGIRKEFGMAQGAFVVSMVGVLRSWKRHDLFLEAVRLLKGRGIPVRALVAGEGPQREKVAAAIRQQGLSDTVTMTGYREDVPEILAASDAIVLPSDRFEGVPQVILQALAMGRPVIASPIGGIPEVVHAEKTGLLCATGDAAAFAGALARLAGDAALGGRTVT